MKEMFKTREEFNRWWGNYYQHSNHQFLDHLPSFVLSDLPVPLKFGIYQTFFLLYNVHLWVSYSEPQKKWSFHVRGENWGGSKIGFEDFEETQTQCINHAFRLANKFLKPESVIYSGTQIHNIK